MAERGFRVDASDLVPVAVEVAREIATNRNLDIHYAVMDVTEIPHIGTKYDLIVDSYCLQGIVLDSDRGRVFSAVHARLNPRGYYLISTAMYDPSRHHGEDRTVDSDSGRVFHRYDDHDIFDPQTDIQYGLFSDDELGDGPEDYEASVRVADNWYLPHRRYRTPEGLRSELEDQRFRVLLQRGEYGENVVCTRAGSSTSLLPR